MTTYNLSAYPVGVTPGPARVWTSPGWSTAFTLRDDMIPRHSTFASGGENSSATVEYRFGRVLVPGSSNFVDLSEITARGYFVLIEWIADDGSLMPWLGYAEAPVTLERYHGDDSTPSGGLQSIPCYGFERILAQAWITTTVHFDSGGELARKPLGSVFNPSATRGNKKTTSGVSAFANPTDDGSFWSTRDIVQHLFAYHLPTPDGLPTSIPWTVENLAGLPTWDKPQLETNDRSVAECLNSLLSPERLLGWRIEPTVSPSGYYSESPPSVQAIKVIPYSLSPTPVTLPSVGSLAANPATISIITDGDPLTEIVNKSVDSLDTVDQLILRGPREVAVCTLRHTTNDGPLEKAWTDDQENIYKTGGANALEFYTDLKQYEQRERNERVRNTGKNLDVFSLLRIKKDWHGQAGGVGVFYKPEGEAIDHDPYLGNVEILSVLPLYDEIDYSGDISDKDEKDGKKKMAPILLLQDPGDPNIFYDPTGSLNLDAGFQPRDGGKIPFGVSLAADNDRGPAIRLSVQGGPAHALAGPSFAGNEADVRQEVFGNYSYTTLAATVAIKSDRNASYAIPATISGSPDIVRRKIITIEHPALELVYVAPGTVVGLEETGERKTCGGGLLRDPFPLLEALATLAANRQLTPKHSIELATGRRLPIKPGSVMQYLNGESVSAIIREVSIRVESAAKEMKVTQSIKASTAAIDILSLMRAAR